MTVVYLDILFIINFVMDCMIFIVAATILNERGINKRIIVGSTIAALLYCIGVCIPYLENLPYYIYYFLIPIIPIIYIFKPSRFGEFVKQYIISFCAAFIIGGATFNLYYLMSISLPNKSVSMFLPLTTGGIITILFVTSAKFIRERFVLPRFEYRVEIIQKGKEVVLEGLVDTGNSLYTSLSCKPVTVIAYETLKSVMTEEQKQVVELCKQKGIIEVVNEIDSIKTYCIPYMSVGCEGGELLGVEVEKMILTKGKYKKEYTNMVVAICDEGVLANWMYDVLLHPEMLT